MSHPLLTAPIGRSLLRLAGPITGLMFVQIGVGVAEMWVTGRLGTDSLAGLALVIPFMVLMLNSANGGMGGAVAAALARALGAGRMDDARALLLHALVVGCGFAAVFTVLAWTVAPAAFAAMGGHGDVLRQALIVTEIWFSGAALTWVACFLTAMLRGSGDTATPSRIGLAMALLYIPLAALLALGVGEVKGFGIAGLSIASMTTTVIAVALQARVIRQGRLGFVPAFKGVRLQRRLFGEILQVGLMGSVSTITASASAVIVTGLVGQFGTAALAGYGIAARLEFMVAPLAFGIGAGLTTMVGVAAGANDWRRAVRIAWIGGLIAFATIGTIGWAIALLPEAWAQIFASDPAVIAAAAACITRAAPFYCLFGMGLTLNFAGQGAGYMKAPFIASIVRMLVATIGGWLAIEKLGLGLHGVFAAIAASLVVYGLVIGGSLLLRPWRAKALPAEARTRESAA
ncbi:MAG TPA: MATE family efflux transporter [Reyranella sp.]|nr:MATE family efflux transporter [Reyranella sp.]